MQRLLATADVFVTNLRPDALERLGLDHGALRERYPSLVYASVTGYGLDGPDRIVRATTSGCRARSSMASRSCPTASCRPGSAAASAIT